MLTRSKLGSCQRTGPYTIEEESKRVPRAKVGLCQDEQDPCPNSSSMLDATL